MRSTIRRLLEESGEGSGAGGARSGAKESKRVHMATTHRLRHGHIESKTTGEFFEAKDSAGGSERDSASFISTIAVEGISREGVDQGMGSTAGDKDSNLTPEFLRAVIRLLGFFVFKTPRDSRGSTLTTPGDRTGGRDVECLMSGGGEESFLGGMGMPGMMIFVGSSPWMRAATPALVPFLTFGVVSGGGVWDLSLDDKVKSLDCAGPVEAGEVERGGVFGNGEIDLGGGGEGERDLIVTIAGDSPRETCCPASSWSEGADKAPLVGVDTSVRKEEEEFFMIVR